MPLIANAHVRVRSPRYVAYGRNNSALNKFVEVLCWRKTVCGSCSRREHHDMRSCLVRADVIHSPPAARSFPQRTHIRRKSGPCLGGGALTNFSSGSDSFVPQLKSVGISMPRDGCRGPPPPKVAAKSNDVKSAILAWLCNQS